MNGTYLKVTTICRTHHKNFGGKEPYDGTLFAIRYFGRSGCVERVNIAEIQGGIQLSQCSDCIRKEQEDGKASGCVQPAQENR